MKRKAATTFNQWKMQPGAVRQELYHAKLEMFYVTQFELIQIVEMVLVESFKIVCLSKR